MKSSLLKISIEDHTMSKLKKILICGASGFIGRNMAEYFAAQNDVEVYGTYWTSQKLKHPKIKMFKINLTNQKNANQIVKGMDIIIQAAAVTSGARDIIEKPYIHVTDNAIMNSLIFRAAHQHHVSHVIFFSCSIMYPSHNTPVSEDIFNPNHEIHPAYFGAAWTKIYIEKMCKFYSTLGHTKYTAIRHSNIYGPHDKFDLKHSHVFGATTTKIMKTQNKKITLWGNGEEERDLLYISDLIHFVDLSIEKQKTNFELCNVGCGETISINDLAKKIIHGSEKQITIKHNTSGPSIKTKICLDISKAKQLFGWKPQISLDEGIKQTLNWYKFYFTQ